MFNLIRGMNGLPFAHYDVTRVTSLTGSKLSPKVGGGRNVTENTYDASTVTNRGPTGLVTGLSRTVGAAAAAVETIARPFAYELAGERNNQVTVEIQPIFDEPKIYEAYVEFLNAGAASGRNNQTAGKASGQTNELAVEKKVTETTTNATGAKEKTVETTTETLPTSAPTAVLEIKFDEIMSVAHSKNRPTSDYIKGTETLWDGEWYYIPARFKRQFSKLCVKVVARGAVYVGDSPAALEGLKKKSSETKLLERIDSTLMINPAFQGL